jgi:hypothetical protein
VGLRNAREATFTYELLAGIPPQPGLLEDSEVGEVAREALERCLQEGEFEREFKNEGIVLGYRYENSPICIPDGTPAPPDDVGSYFPTARPGSRAPHVWLDAGRSTLDLFGRGFTLMVLGPDPVAPDALVDAAEARGVPLEVVRLRDSGVSELYERDLVLVRPDGHVAWRSDSMPEQPLEILDVVRGAAKSAATATQATRDARV